MRVNNEGNEVFDHNVFNGGVPCISLDRDIKIVEYMLSKIVKKYKKVLSNYDILTGVRELKRIIRVDDNDPCLSYEEKLFLKELIVQGENLDGNPWGMFTQTDGATDFTETFHAVLNDRRIIYESLEELSVEKPDIVESWKDIFDMIIVYKNNILHSYPQEYKEIFGEENGNIFFSFLRPNFILEQELIANVAAMTSILDYKKERDLDNICDALLENGDRCGNLRSKSSGLYCHLHKEYFE